jgi:undecaprenyl-diphosphatase
VIDPWYAGACAVAGAIAGDATSYELGRHHRDAMLSMWPLSKHPALVARGEAYFVHGGAKAVFVGRFLGPARAIVPLVAGMANMPPLHFYSVNVVSAFGWAAAHLVPGILFGASLALAGAVSSRLVGLVALVAAGFWVVTHVTKLVMRRGWPYVHRLRVRIQQYAQTTHGPFGRVFGRLFDPTQHEPMAILVSAVLLVGGAWLFLGVVEDVVTNDTLVDVDRAIYMWLSSVRTRFGDDVMVVITELSGVYVMSSVVVALAIWFAVTRRFRTLAYWLSAAIFSQALVFALKYALGRARPPGAHGVIEGFSFPSGHAAQSLVVFGFLAFLLGHGKPMWQQTAYTAGAATIALLVALSRLYLGAHWFSDVVASFGLATAWIALLAIAYIQHVHERRLRAAPVLLILLATMTFVGGWYAGNHHTEDLARYAKQVRLPVMTLDAWRARDYEALDAARTEVNGDLDEPFTVQWAASRDGVARALERAGWTVPAAWRSSALLLWLVPSTPIAQLPVLPKLHRGEPPALTFIHVVDTRERLVLRLWHLADAEAPAGLVVPIFVGMITRERSHPEWHLVTVTNTISDDVAPTKALAGAWSNEHAQVRPRASGPDVLLVW